MVSKQDITAIANILRRDVLEMTTKAGSGHPTSCLSCAEIMATLFFHEMKYSTPENLNNDQFILSKGHSAPILYAALKRAGKIKDSLSSLRTFSSRLEGHPNPRTFPWVKVGTGSLGQGLSIGLGMALAAKQDKKQYTTYVLMGDGEVAEGSVYEAAELAGQYGVDTLVGIVDVNRLGQSGPTMLGHKLKTYKKRFDGFGWKTYIVHGHNPQALLKVFAKAKKQKKPVMILAKTEKGKGISFLEGKEGWHGKALDELQFMKAIKELPDETMPKVTIKKPKNYVTKKAKAVSVKTMYPLQGMIATREAYGYGLAAVARKNKKIIAVDAEVRGSTHADAMLNVDKSRFYDAYIAEQNMVGMGLGLAVQGHPVFMSTFAAFFTRAHDQLRMSALSKANVNVVGSHAGVSIGADGVSQMGLEDIGLFRSLPGSTVLYPSDAVSCAKLVGKMVGKEDLCYLRTTRAKTPVIYKNAESFPLGRYKVVRRLPKAKIVFVGAGITLPECLKAHELLKKKKIPSLVVDCYCIKPFDRTSFRKLAKGKKVVVVEDHYPEGGMGEVIREAVQGMNVEVKHLCVREIPHSGKSEQLLKKYKIDADAIVKVAT